MTEPKILLLDADGTLVRHDTSLPASAAEAVRAARARGHEVFICTGRARAEVYEHLWELGLDGMIGGNGSYIEHRGEVVHHQVLDVDVVEQAVAWLHGKGLAFYLECNSGLFGSQDLPEQAAERLGKTPDFVRSIFPEMVHDTSRGHDDVNKISFVLPRGMELDELHRLFDGRARIGSWTAAGVEDEFGEIGQLGVDKAKGVRILAERLGRETSDLIGFGDARSDIPLLQACGTGVAMGQAPDELKALADLVTDHVDHDGLAKAFQELGLV
ncbi:Cof-type HAD-IIB family hydrolase [Luteococcus sp.]|uniref:Cof-type HAD-IIB family hydrolase n=1 Tax=Luteococcus sp. TaxID=1969402 RepID=UPI0037353FAD